MLLCERIKNVGISLLNSTMAIFVAVSWSEAFVSIIEHFVDEDEHTPPITVFLIFLWNVVLYGIVILILHFLRLHPKLVAISRPFGELLGFQFKNGVIALASTKLFGKSWEHTLYAALIAMFILVWLIALSRYIRNYQKRSDDVTPEEYEHHQEIINETEIDGAAVAVGFSIQMVINYALLNSDGKPTLENNSGLPSTNSTHNKVEGFNLHTTISVIFTVLFSAAFVHWVENWVHNLELDVKEEQKGKTYDQSKKLTSEVWKLRRRIIFGELLLSSAALFVGWSISSYFEKSIPHYDVGWLPLSNFLYSLLVTVILWGFMVMYKGYYDKTLDKHTSENEDAKVHTSINDPANDPRLKRKAKRRRRKIITIRLILVSCGFVVGWLWEESWDGFLHKMTESNPILWELLWALLLTVGYAIYCALAPWALHANIHDSEHDEKHTNIIHSNSSLNYHKLEGENH